MKKVALLSLIVLVFDQILKFIIRSKLVLNETINVIANFFNITYVENDGAAWNILSGNKIILILIALLVLFFIFYYFIFNKKLNKIEVIAYSLFIGGLLGNLSDRIFIGRVIDYLDFKIFGYNFPVFNLADICIVLGVLIIIINEIRGEINEKTNSNGRK